MNCYDFDKTIYESDSSMDFYLFCLQRHKKMFKRIPRQMMAFFKHYVLHSITKTQMKEIFYEYFQDIPHMEKELEEFWNAHLHKIKPFYKAQQKEDDVIISASPEFFLTPACKTLGITHLIASPVDAATGCYLGENCHGEEKVRRFSEHFPNAQVDEFYSDSYSDTPMAKLSRKAYLVKGNIVTDWNKK